MKKKLTILIGTIILVLLVLSTTTYALFFKQDKLEKEESYTVGILDIVLENDEEGLGEVLSLANSIPITDEEGKTSKSYKFKIINKGNLAYKFNLKILTTTTSNQIDSNYIKVMIDENEPVLLSSLASSIIASNLTLNPGESKIMSVRLWLDEYTPNSQIGKTFTAKIVGEGKACEEQFPLDESGANSPDLVKGLIPVMYKDNVLVKADTNNLDANFMWYNYDDKIWANAVLVTSTNRSKYQNANVGTEILEADVLAHYVWIPRYKYKLFNATKATETDAYDAEHKGIDIVFEKDTETTGTVSCSIDDMGKETCTNANNLEYYTHPAFKFDNIDLKGIWAAKFKLSGNSSKPTIKPNSTFLTNMNISSFFTTITKMNNSEVYGTNTDSDFHVIKNMEYGAITYLSHSKYGYCTNQVCDVVTSSSDDYKSTSGLVASTTKNVYGIYDMTPGTSEYTMATEIATASNGRGLVDGNAFGNYTCPTTSQGSGYSGYNFNINNALHPVYCKYLEPPAEKYFDFYEAGTTSSHLGDASREILISGNSSYNCWNKQSCGIGSGIQYDESWFYRENILSYRRVVSKASPTASTRPILIPIK